MPKAWIYYIALVVLLAVHVLVMHTRFFIEWLWYQGYADLYNALNELSVQPQMMEYFGSWALPVFIITVFTLWLSEYNQDDNIGGQFAMLPLVYTPFLIVGNAVTAGFEVSMLYTYPLVVILAGYLYILPWALFVWAFDKMRLVV